eukprot:GHVH01016656.1.p2 GENE.GHVH01016656.1~~GHVH01016656.1.p2  ORF type:complete len:306 (+),score=45.35 GHVH01016656.1:1652-2569(+)
MDLAPQSAVLCGRLAVDFLSHNNEQFDIGFVEIKHTLTTEEEKKKNLIIANVPPEHFMSPLNKRAVSSIWIRPVQPQSESSETPRPFRKKKRRGCLNWPRRWSSKSFTAKDDSSRLYPNRIHYRRYHRDNMCLQGSSTTSRSTFEKQNEETQLLIVPDDDLSSSGVYSMSSKCVTPPKRNRLGRLARSKKNKSKVLDTISGESMDQRTTSVSFCDPLEDAPSSRTKKSHRLSASLSSAVRGRRQLTKSSSIPLKSIIKKSSFTDEGMGPVEVQPQKDKQDEEKVEQFGENHPSKLLEDVIFAGDW